MHWNPRNIKIKDHRGQLRSLCAVEDLPAETPEHVKEALADPGGEPEVFLGCAAVPVLLFVLFVVGTLFGIGDEVHRVAFLVIIGLIAIGFMNRPMTDRAVIRAALAVLGEGRCASCGYSLTDAGPEADGCRVCPECGAAWKLHNTSAEESED